MPPNNEFPPPPQPGFTQHPNQSTPNVNIPPYNPADYAGPPTPAGVDPHGYPADPNYGYPPPEAHRGDNVSSSGPSIRRRRKRRERGRDVQKLYFSPPPTGVGNEEGASTS